MDAKTKKLLMYAALGIGVYYLFIRKSASAGLLSPGYAPSSGQDRGLPGYVSPTGPVVSDPAWIERDTAYNNDVSGGGSF